MAFDDSGRDPKWPKVADAVIEAQIFIQVLFIKAMEFQQVTDSMLASQSNRRQPGPLIEHPGHHLPESALPVHTVA